MTAGYRVCIHTNESRPDLLAGCLEAGAHGVVHKAAPLSALSTFVGRVGAGEVAEPSLPGRSDGPGYSEDGHSR